MTHLWQERPADQQFPSLDTAYEFAKSLADRSTVERCNLQELKAQADDDTFWLESPTQTFKPTHWSLGQLTSWTKQPGATTYLRTKSPKMLALNLNDDIHVRGVAEPDLAIYAFQHPTRLNTARAFTSQTYGRIYDHNVIDMVRDVTGDNWKVPSEVQHVSPNAARRASTLYVSDRDCWLFLVDESRPITIPGTHGALYRGVIIWNSEVRARSFGLLTFLYSSVCANRTIFGIKNEERLVIRHTSGGPDRFLREGRPMLEQYAQQSPKIITDRIQRAKALKAGDTKDDVLDFLTKMSFPKKQAEAIIVSAAAQENEYSSLWALTQGATAVAREIPHTDARFQAEQRAATILAKAA